MGTLGTDVGMEVAILPPKLGPFGARKGLGDPGFGRPPGAASRTAFHPGHCQVGPHPGCLVLVFSLFCIWVPANQESPKLVEMVRNKSYDYFFDD